MVSKFQAPSVLFLSFNLLFFVLVSSSGTPSDGVGGILDGLLNGIGGNSNDNAHDSSTSTLSRDPVVIRPGDRYTNANGQPGTCNPLNLGVCLNVLGGLLNLEVGNVPSQQCCSLIQGLVDLEASVCLCTAIRANVLDMIKLDVPISLSLNSTTVEGKPQLITCAAHECWLYNNVGKSVGFDFNVCVCLKHWHCLFAVISLCMSITSRL
ncbi:hypothetical protein V6N13_137490 [Hibiscus sabdariffa]|uniref:Bifunctional inhibitor/plant lipid transfer protein/seed storage helical domain-containing protein n=1 Tax=Hibiscus sabdariffa TaxID=183260 RepID=A0ABR2DKJ1_9ROSI